MKKRVIGGCAFLFLYLGFLFSEFYYLMFAFFLVVATIEFIKAIKDKKVTKYAIAYLFIFSLGILSMMTIASINKGLLFYMSVLVMLGDTFAYIGGKNFGKHNFSKISPNKTIEGSLIGLVSGFFLTSLLFILLTSANFGQLNILDFSQINDYKVIENNFIWFIFSIIVLILGQLGDLAESKFKRIYEIKDSGTIVYGHGGILDRLDSWFINSIFVLVLIIIGVI